MRRGFFFLASCYCRYFWYCELLLLLTSCFYSEAVLIAFSKHTQTRHVFACVFGVYNPEAPYHPSSLTRLVGIIGRVVDSLPTQDVVQNHKKVPFLFFSFFSFFLSFFPYFFCLILTFVINTVVEILHRSLRLQKSSGGERTGSGCRKGGVGGKRVRGCVCEDGG